MRVLLVEDDDVCRTLIEATLEKEGYEITSVATGDEALALLAEGTRPDLLVTDIQLPGDVDGWLLARACRDGIPDLPVVYITAADRGDYHVSNSVFLLKPVRSSLLLQAIEAIAWNRERRSAPTLH